MLIRDLRDNPRSLNNYFQFNNFCKAKGRKFSLYRFKVFTMLTTPRVSDYWRFFGIFSLLNESTLTSCFAFAILSCARYVSRVIDHENFFSGQHCCVHNNVLKKLNAWRDCGVCKYNTARSYDTWIIQWNILFATAMIFVPLYMLQIFHWKKLADNGTYFHGFRVLLIYLP